MKYENMSDKDIAFEVAKFMGFEGRCSTTGNILYKNKNFNPCNNVTDAWPIMIKNGISTITENGKIIGATSDSQEYHEPYGNVVHSYKHINPLRASMIVYLKMHEE